MIKRIVTFVSFSMAAAGLSLAASSREADSSPLHRLQERAASSEISFSYTYSASSGKVSMSGQGEVLLHGDAYRLEVDGLEVYCDGKDRWTLDKKAREVVVEPVAPGDADLSANPALLLSRAADFFYTGRYSPVYSGRGTASEDGPQPGGLPSVQGSVYLYCQ